MNQKQRWEWLVRVTGEDTGRKVGRVLHVSHSTIQRWVHTGNMPAEKLITTIVEFKLDPLEACVIWGLLKDDDVPNFNWEAIAHYIPADILAGELHARSRMYLHAAYPDTLRKTSVWDAPKLPDMPSRSDGLERRSFRLTSKA